MARDRSYAIGNRRVKHFPKETFGGVTIGEHYAVEIMTSDGWRHVSVHPNVEAARAAIAKAERRNFIAA